MAEMTLHMLGLSPDEARDLAGRPLPLQREEDLVPLSPPQPQSRMGRWRGPRSMAFWR